MNKRYLRWCILEDMKDYFATLTYKLKVDAIIGISNGGLPAAVVAHHIFKKPLYIMAASSYTEDNKQEKLTLSNVSVPESIKGKNVLLVDDIYDSGKTITGVSQYLMDTFDVTVTSFVLIAKQMPRIQHGVLFLKMVRMEDWVVFPWEIE